MGGFAAYVGRREAAPVLLKALAILDSRDGAGEVAILDASGALATRAAGRLSRLHSLLTREPDLGTCAVGWVGPGSHGFAPADDNGGCPRCRCDVALAFDGIVENADALRALLKLAGHTFATDADAEILSHLIAEAPGATLAARLTAARQRIEGTCSLVAVCRDGPRTAVVAQDGSPVLIGIGDGECFVASGANAILEHTRTVVHLGEGDVAVVTPEGYRLVERPATLQLVESGDLEAVIDAIENRTPPHHARREISEQPDAIRASLRDRVCPAGGEVRLDDLALSPADLDAIQQIDIVATGSSWHAGLLGRTVIEVLARVPVEVKHAGEYRYAPRRPARGTLTIALSRSGENPDTLVAIREARALGSPVLAVVTSSSSTIGREADATILLRAGPELGTAHSKSFTSQLVTLLLFGLLLGRRRGLSPEAGSKFLDRLLEAPDQVARALDLEQRVIAVAERVAREEAMLLLGRGLHHPLALEGALQLTELAHMHAEGHSALETRHGPIGRIGRDVPVVFLAPRDEVLPKLLSSMEEVKARGGRIIAVTNDPGGAVERLADDHLCVPATPPLLAPLVSVVPLQLLAYHVAVLRGYDVDRPQAVVTAAPGP